ncbi:MAG: stalk domain-containing protein [Cellulosilyticaceae bacterium]
MNQKLRKHFKLIVLGGMVAALSLPIFANPLLQKVEAYLNAGLTYVLDGKEVMEDVTALTYNDTTYISIRELSEALGKDISYDNGVITVNTANVPTPKEIKDEVPALPEAITIEKALIKEVDLENGRVTILPAGLEDLRENYIILHVGEDTVVRHELLKIALTSQDLVAGYEVRINHSPIMQPSLPPQTAAFEIVILANQEFPLVEEDKVEVPALPESITIESAVIKAINADSKQVTLLPAGKEDVYTNYVILNVDTDKTFIHHEINKRAYRFEDLTVGTKVRVEHSPIMTMSLPPQTPAKEITILVNQE